MIRLSSAICLPLYVGRYSASSFGSARRPSQLGVSMIKRNGLYLMQLTMTAYSTRYAFFLSSSGGRSLSKYGVVLLATSSATSPKRGSTAVRYATSRNRHSSKLLSCVPRKHDGFPKCRGSRDIMVLVQIRVRIVSRLRYHIEMRHRHHDHFVRLRNDLKRITSLMNHQVQHVMDDCECDASDD